MYLFSRLWRYLECGAVVLGFTLLMACTSPATPGSPAPVSPVGSPNPVTEAAATLPPPSSTPTPLQAILQELMGQVEAAPSPQDVMGPATLGMRIWEQGQVQTGEESRAALDVSDGARVRLGPLTLFTLVQASRQEQGLWARLRLDFGEIWVMLFEQGRLDIETPVGEAAVRGSFMSIGYDPERKVIFVTCLEGHCALTNQAGTFEMLSGQAAEMVSPQQAPQIGVMDPSEVQRWMEINPEATAVLPVMRATMTALPPMPVVTPPPGFRAPATPAGVLTPPATPGIALPPGVPPLSCLSQPETCAAYCGQIPMPQECRDFFAAMQQLGVDIRACLTTSDPGACIQQHLMPFLTVTPSPRFGGTVVATPLATASLEGLQHVPLPPLSCLDSGQDCDVYCGQDPAPADCDAFLNALHSYGIDLDQLDACLGGQAVTREAVQQCVDRLAGLSP